ncbi:hypothetical protein BaRGS_00009589, partial [Batillaria attramentaria]
SMDQTMALQKRDIAGPLDTVGATGISSTKKARKVLDEDTYTERIEKIIVRDFFPDLPKLSVQKAYFDALEQNDLVKLRELQIKYGGKCPTTGRLSSAYNTPASFETPEAGSNRLGSVQPQPQPQADDTAVGSVSKEEEVEKAEANSDKDDLSLDGFLAKHTSEDNASFADILAESERKQREKHAWLFEQEKKQDEEQTRQLALPDIEEQAVIKPRPLMVDTWTYKPKNAVMYVPEGVEYSAKELIEIKKHKGRAVKHENTHFKENPFGSQNKEVLQKAAVHKALVLQGKIGHDGRELTIGQSPQVNGFTLLATPSPAPGAEESPFMTWGEIEGTPLRLDVSEINPSRTPGPVFKIALALAEKASKAHRAKKEAALKQVTRRLASPSPSMSPLERLHSMSPAAQRLASKRLGVRTHTDTALSASYSPLHSRTPGDKTPVHLATPSPSSARPSSSRSARAGNTPDLSHRSPATKPSLTDNLLKLPKRKNAADFF